MLARVRAIALIVLMFISTTLGGVFPPIVANLLAGTYGWPIIFWIGGILPFVIAAICWFAPESIKFLALVPARRDETIRVARRIQPGFTMNPDDCFVSESHNAPRARFGDLFAGKFALITPLLWLLFAINLMVFYFVNIWLQTVITPAILKAGGDAATAQDAGLMFQLSGSICALIIARFVDKMGLKPVILLILFGIPRRRRLAISPPPRRCWVWVAFASVSACLRVYFVQLRIAAGCSRQRLAAETDGALLRAEHAGNHAYCGRLARPVCAQQRHDLAGLHADRHVAHRQRAVIGEGKARNLERAHAAGC